MTLELCFLDRDDFVEFARICYTKFGKKVKNWITLNEPWSFSSMGYCLGRHAPGRCTPDLFPYPETCPAGDSTTEPYIVAHNLLLAHAKAAKLYKDEFQVNMTKVLINSRLKDFYKYKLPYSIETNRIFSVLLNSIENTLFVLSKIR